MELKREQNRLDKERDAARPRASGNWRYDLPESKRMAMQSAFRSLEAWREIHSGSKHDAEYDTRFEAIEKEYEQYRRKETPSGSTEVPTVKNDPLGLFK
jgi:16S rRNA C967 or C1407 C5-methylase (RsmB/RsmF family)